MLLYSTNAYLKLYLQEYYFKDVHYVWCSDNYDRRKLASRSLGSLVPASSNPAEIYEELKRDVRSKDRHSAKIIAQRTSIKSLANTWASNGIITSNDRDDIEYMVDTADIDYWRPLIYVIPKAPVIHKLKTVPAARRAGLGVEYIIEDLLRTEFDIIEP